MGSNRKLIFGALLVVAGFIIWGLYSSFNNTNRVATPTPVPSTTVAVTPNAGNNADTGLYAHVVADIPQGSIVTREMIEMRPLPGGARTTNAVTNLESQAIGYITRVPIPKDALIRPADFVGHISETGIAGALRPGTRAMTIAFTNKPTLHDLVRIGNFVDVNAAFDGQEARTIAQNLRILAVDVFVNDFPQVNGAARGPYKADPKGRGIDSSPPAPGAVTASGAPPAPGAAPTPTPAPAQAPPRPDPSITLEVTPAQANTILLAQASGGVLDFVVRPALPGGRSPDIILVDGGLEAGTGSAAGQGTAGTATGITTVSAVTKAQIAPYAERKKASGAASGRAASGNGRSSGSGSRSSGADGSDRDSAAPRLNRSPRYPRPVGSDSPLPSLSPVEIPRNTGAQPSFGPNTGTGTPSSDGVTFSSPTYEIPIYADGKIVRTETVRRPQD